MGPPRTPINISKLGKWLARCFPNLLIIMREAFSKAETCVFVWLRTRFSTGASGMVRIWELPCPFQHRSDPFKTIWGEGEDGGACIHLHLGNGVRVSACTVKMGRVHPHAPLPWGACIRMHVKNGARASACKCENYPSHLRASACT